MQDQTASTGRSLVGSVLQCRCPHCREGHLFSTPNPYDLRTTMRMPENCAVCGQAFELHTGFYFGTGYVSYGLSVLLLALGFIAWALTVGFSTEPEDMRLYWCLLANSLFLVLVQPLIQRLSRSIWIAIFVRYDRQWRLRGGAAA